VLWIFLNAYPDLPVWAKLCRAYGAESGIGASSTRRINQKLKEPASRPPACRQAGRRYKFSGKQRQKRPPNGGRYKGKTVAGVARN